MVRSRDQVREENPSESSNKSSRKFQVRGRQASTPSSDSIPTNSLTEVADISEDVAPSTEDRMEATYNVDEERTRTFSGSSTNSGTSFPSEGGSSDRPMGTSPYQSPEASRHVDPVQNPNRTETDSGNQNHPEQQVTEYLGERPQAPMVVPHSDLLSKKGSSDRPVETLSLRSPEASTNVDPGQTFDRIETDSNNQNHPELQVTESAGETQPAPMVPHSDLLSQKGSSDQSLEISLLQSSEASRNTDRVKNPNRPETESVDQTQPKPQETDSSGERQVPPMVRHSKSWSQKLRKLFHGYSRDSGDSTEAFSSGGENFSPQPSTSMISPQEYQSRQSSQEEEEAAATSAQDANGSGEQRNVFYSNAFEIIRNYFANKNSSSNLEGRLQTDRENPSELSSRPSTGRRSSTFSRAFDLVSSCFEGDSDEGRRPLTTSTTDDQSPPSSAPADSETERQFPSLNDFDPQI